MDNHVEVFDLTGDTDSDCGGSTTMSVVKSERPVRKSSLKGDCGREVVDLTNSPMTVENSSLKPSELNNHMDKGRPTCLITDFYSSSPKKKPKISQSPSKHRNILEVVSINSTPASDLKLSAHNTCARFLSAASSIPLQEAATNSKKEIETNIFDGLNGSADGITPPHVASVDTSLCRGKYPCPLSPLASRSSPGYRLKASSSSSLSRKDILPSSTATDDRMQIDLTMELNTTNREDTGAEWNIMRTKVSPKVSKVDLTETAVASSYSTSLTAPSDPSTAAQLQRLLGDFTLSTKKFCAFLNLMFSPVLLMQESSSYPIVPSSSGTSCTSSATGSGARASSHDKKSGETPVMKARLNHLYGRLFPFELSGRESSPSQLSDALLCIVQDALQLNPACQSVRKLFKEALSRQDARVYLMLAEAKCAYLRKYCGQIRSRHGVPGLGRNESTCASGAFDVFGLGRPKELIILLCKLFHSFNEADYTEWVDRNSAGYNNAHNSGEKARSVKSKTAQRRAEQQEISDALKSIEMCSTAGDSMGEIGVVNAATLKVRTEMDARHAIALRRSSECALGLRIITVWCDYIKHLSELIALQARFDLLVGCRNNIIALLLDLDQLVTNIRSAHTKSAKDESVTEKDARYAVAKITELNAELMALLSVQQLQPGAPPFSQLPTYVEEAWQDLLQLSEAFPEFQDWCDAQESRGSPSSIELSQRYITTLIQTLYHNLLEVIDDWNTLNIANTTLRFLAHRTNTIVERVATVLSAHTQASSLVLEQTPTLKTALVKLQKMALKILGRMRLSLFALSTQAKMLDKSSGRGIERQWNEAAELVAALYIQNGGDDKRGSGARRSREDQLLDVVCALEKKCSLAIIPS